MSIRHCMNSSLVKSKHAHRLFIQFLQFRSSPIQRQIVFQAPIINMSSLNIGKIPELTIGKHLSKIYTQINLAVKYEKINEIEIEIL